MNLKHPLLEVKDDDAYKSFIHQVAINVRELGTECKKLHEKLPAKQEDIFEPTIEIEIGMNKLNALCDLGASVSTIAKSLYDKFNLGPFVISEMKLNMADSTYTQVVGIKHGVIIQVYGCTAIIDLAIVDMPEDHIVPIILGRPFLRTIKATINVYEGNVRFDLPCRDPFVKKKS
jgi:hypothetical protein